MQLRWSAHTRAVTALSGRLCSRAHGCDDLRDGFEDDIRPVAHDVVAAALGEDGSAVRRGGDEVAMSPANRVDLLRRLDPRALGDDVDGRCGGRDIDLP